MIRHDQRGTILVVVAGLCALLSAMSLAFVMRMRADGEDAHRMSQDIQARVMLTSALMYVQETGRLGWGGETFGWRDVRDGMPGPRDFFGQWPAMFASTISDDGLRRPAVTKAFFPVVRGTAARNPMYVMRRPPFAIRSTIAPNPVPIVDPGDNATAPWDQLINYAVADPSPVTSDPGAFASGDLAPLQVSGIASWFRVYRSGVTTFVITCGSGASQGFRDWQEVVDTPGAADIFGNQADFEAIRSAEVRRWYEAEWSDLVTGNNFMHGHYARHNQRTFGNPNLGAEETPNKRNLAGTFAYIASLPSEPLDW
ncbi:MAG: hypothetical protein H0X45_03780 [Planctomycetes bacterium]|nr:hypothetical protein [Planctomycetota bacterium]